jgi:uncharacterized protein (DUF433 family)
MKLLPIKPQPPVTSNRMGAVLAGQAVEARTFQRDAECRCGIAETMPEITPPDEKAQQLLRLLVEAIKRGRILPGDPGTFLPYSEALLLLGRKSPEFRSGSRLQKLGLAALNRWTMSSPDLPKIAALIVNKKSHTPSPIFARSHGHGDDPEWKVWWMAEANRAIHYDWSPFLRPMERYRGETPGTAGSYVGESREEEAAAAYGAVIVVDPPPAHIRQTKITVDRVLRWMAAGKSESDILRRNPELRQADIRASLAYAADREAHTGKPRFTERWSGKFKLPEPDPADARLTYLLERYEKNRK